MLVLSFSLALPAGWGLVDAKFSCVVADTSNFFPKERGNLSKKEFSLGAVPSKLRFVSLCPAHSLIHSTS